MKTNRKIAAVLLGCSLFFAPTQSADAASKMHVPDTIYEWVQSSSRMNYFFNKEIIQFTQADDGTLHADEISVPILKTYDPIQIHDVVEKRRWRLADTDHLEDLAGEAVYVRINLKTRQVHVRAVELLDTQMATLEEANPNRDVDLATLSPKSQDFLFYTAVIEYAKKHTRELVLHARKGKLTEEDEKWIKHRERELEKERKHEQKEREKRERAAREAKEESDEES